MARMPVYAYATGVFSSRKRAQKHRSSEKTGWMGSFTRVGIEGRSGNHDTAVRALFKQFN